jgi:hypothetical protein
MVELPLWQHSGSVVRTGDLSLLESDLHAGRVAAAERGYESEPDSIEVNDVMLSPTTQRLITEEEAVADGVRFVPTHTQYVMTWKAQG